MNLDDPKLTACALNELDPADRAEMEQLLCENPAAAAEVEATRAFAAQLGLRLKAERADALHPAQRAEVLASLPAKPRNVIAFSRRAAAWSAIAASVLIGVGIALLFPALNAVKENAVSSKSRSRTLPVATITDGSQIGVGLTPEPLPKAAPPSEPSAPIAGDPSPVKAPNAAVYAKSSLGAVPPAAIPPATTPGIVPSVDEVKKLMTEAEGFYNTARYDLAYKRGEQVLAMDAYNIPARKMQEKINLQRDNYANASVNEARSRAIWQTDVKWANPVRKFDFDKGISQHLAAAPAKAKSFSLAKNDTQSRGGRMSLDSDSLVLADQPETTTAESYDDTTDNPFLKPTDAPLSTFSIDVDTASYANVRRFLNGNALPPRAAVRIEEMVNYFHYDYPQPEGDAPFSSAMEIASCPWAPEHRLLRVGLHGRDIARAARPASNLIFLIDVSGSMQPENKLPLLKRSLALMVDQLGERDQVGIVVYAGAAGCVLESTHSKDKIRAALDRLESGGSTHGSAGLELAYELATQHFIKGGTNRVILATDGDWNVGVTGKGDLWQMIERKAKSGVFLTVLGFGMDNLKDDMLEKLADKGNGNYAYIDTLNEGRKVLVDELGATLVTIAKDVKIQIEFNPAQVGAYRLIGYENRVMAAKDFADDTKDAGEIGAGHSVTAFYEIVPAGKEIPAAAVERLKYQSAPAAPEEKLEVRSQKSEVSDEMLTLKLRYKAPDSDTSTLKEFPFKDTGHTFAQSTRDFRFASAVAGCGMILRQSPYKGSANWALIHELAVEGKGDDRDGYRAEFVGLVEKARAMSR